MAILQEKHHQIVSLCLYIGYSVDGSCGGRWILTKKWKTSMYWTVLLELNKASNADKYTVECSK